MRAETDQPGGNGDALRVGVGMDVGHDALLTDVREGDEVSDVP
jgi:hypothetical protein